jgi:ApaG protein
MFERVTRKVKVSVQPAYLADQSAPDHNHYFWAYTVQIENESAETIQLRTRHWRIIDANGRTLEVKGAGVVGARARSSSTVPALRWKRPQA